MAKDLALAANGDLFIDDTGDFEIIDAVRQGKFACDGSRANGYSIRPWVHLTLKQFSSKLRIER